MATFTVTKRLSVLIGCCYRPPNTTEEYMHKVSAELRAPQQRHQEAMYLLGGDFNLPDINWRDASVTGHQNPLAVNRGFLEAFDDIGLTQIVDFPTHSNPDHTLDLILTNRPSLIQRCEHLPGVADHDEDVPALTGWSKRCSEWRDKPSTTTSWISLIRQQTPMPSGYIHTWGRRRKTVAASVLCGAPMARRTHPQVGRRTSSTTNSPPSSLMIVKMRCRSWSPRHTKRCLGLISMSTG